MRHNKSDKESRFVVGVCLALTAATLVACDLLRGIAANPETATKPTCEAIEVAYNACKIIRVKMKDGSEIELSTDDLVGTAAAKAGRGK